MQQKSAQILVVEDHPVNQKVLQLLLDYLGFTSDLVSGGREAIDSAIHNRYSLVLMDVMMPEIDGFTATQRIREFEFGTGRHTPIVAVTALSKDDVRERCLAAGMDDYISKPISKEILKRKLYHWMPLSTSSAMDDYQSGSVGVAADDYPIDRERMKLLYETDNLEPILKLFMEVSETLMSELNAAIGERNVAKVTRTAHELKGSSYAVSAREMAKLSLELEQAGEEQRWAEAVQIYLALSLGFLHVKEYLNGSTRFSKTAQ